MPGFTDWLSLPYPLDTDPIDVAGDMESLAKAVDVIGANAFRRWVDYAETRSVIPNGPLDADRTTPVDWVVSTASVPDWAKRIQLVVTVAGFYMPTGTAPSSAFELTTRLAQRYGRNVFHSPTAVNQRDTLTWVDTLEVVTPGAQQIAVLAMRRLGDGILRVDDESTVTFGIQYSA